VYFIVYIMVGKYILMNLFLAILLRNYNSGGTIKTRDICDFFGCLCEKLSEVDDALAAGAEIVEKGVSVIVQCVSVFSWVRVHAVSVFSWEHVMDVSVFSCITVKTVRLTMRFARWLPEDCCSCC